jgi:tetratricopeptide (TPR) repeat protein
MPTIDEALSYGWQRHQAHEFAQAEQIYRQVIAAAPQAAAAWCYLGMALHDQERHAEAIEAFQRTVALDPAMAVAWQNFGKTLGRLRRFDEAIACFDRAIALSPGYLNAYKNKARAVFFKGDLAATHQLYELLLRLDPTDVETHMSLGMLRLQQGDAAGGWPDYEWRWKSKDGALPPLTQPLWRGESLAGKSILLTPEQGLGDSIQFIRYAAVLKERYDCRVLFHCPRSLVQLLSSCPGVDQLIEGGTPAPASDYFAPLVHVPAMLDQAPQDFPGNVPYLTPDSALVAAWRERLAGYFGLKVGLAWRGSPKHPADRMRSIPLAEFAPLAVVPGVQLFSLQKGAGSEELPPLAERLRIIDIGRQLDEKTGAFVETAAVLKNLDLLIACDTAIVHVAGALGVPVWLALGNVPDWRWLLARDDTPAYPSFRLFRQATFGDWPGVFRRMAGALREWNA